MRLGLLVLAATGSLAMPASAFAQERCATSASEIIDPFVTVPRVRAAGAAMGVVVAEILDPFAATPARSRAVPVVSEIVDPFVAGGSAAGARSEILDPWSS